MDPRFLPVVDGLLLLILFVATPALMAAIGYIAWKRQLTGFYKQRFLTLAFATGIPAFLLMIYAQRLKADVRTPEYFWQLLCFVVGSLLFGFAGGCLAGFLVNQLRRKNA